MPKFITVEEAVKLIPDGATVMFGGFMGCGNAHKFIDALSKSGVKDLTMISNDASMPGGPMGVGLNPEVATQSMVDGTLEVQLIPQGSLAEMIRAGGGGLGGVLTPAGVGTIVEESPYCLGKQTIDGRDYLLMKPIHADFAVICGAKIDKAGNVWYKGNTSNFNLVMATAADTVIAEAEEIVEIGEIEPENVRTYGVFVDYVVEGGKL